MIKTNTSMGMIAGMITTTTIRMSTGNIVMKATRIHILTKVTSMSMSMNIRTNIMSMSMPTITTTTIMGAAIAKSARCSSTASFLLS